jgi:fumarate reductase subunit C
MKTKEYVRPIPSTWWLHNHHLTLFMVRELTSVFVAGYAVFLMVMLYRAGQGREAFHGFYEALKSPVSIVLHLIVLAFVLFHAVTWLNLTPKVVIVWRGEEKVPPAVIAGAHYVLWLIVSVLVWWIATA